MISHPLIRGEMEERLCAVQAAIAPRAGQRGVSAISQMRPRRRGQ